MEKESLALSGMAELEPAAKNPPATQSLNTQLQGKVATVIASSVANKRVYGERVVAPLHLRLVCPCSSTFPPLSCALCNETFDM